MKRNSTNNDNSAPPSFNSNPHNNHGWGPSWNLDYSGGNGFASTNEPNHEADWSIAGALDYHLGAVILHACNGYYSGQVLSSSSNPNTRNSVFFAMPGIATIGDYTWDSLWSQSIFDDQATSRSSCLMMSLPHGVPTSSLSVWILTNLSALGRI